jgi:hypothetical protein
MRVARPPRQATSFWGSDTKTEVGHQWDTFGATQPQYSRPSLLDG